MKSDVSFDLFITRILVFVCVCVQQALKKVNAIVF